MDKAAFHFEVGELIMQKPSIPHPLRVINISGDEVELEMILPSGNKTTFKHFNPSHYYSAKGYDWESVDRAWEEAKKHRV
jgi:hypothetical protein